MNKFASLAIALLLIFGGALWFLASGSLNAFIKAQITLLGSQYTEQTVTVANVDMKLAQGAGTISGLTLSNPKQFQQKHAFSLDKINLDINLKSLTQEPIVIEVLLLDNPQAFVELSKQGKTNFGEILDALERNLPKSEPGVEPSSAENKKPEPMIRVEKIIVSGVALTLDLRQLGNKVHQATLADINLSNIGGEAGLPASELGGEIVKQVLKAIAKEAKKQQKKKLTKKLTDKLKSGLSDFLKKL